MEGGWLDCDKRPCRFGVRGYRAGGKGLFTLAPAVSGPARRKPRSVGETGNDPATDLRMFANRGGLERGGNPDEARVKPPEDEELAKQSPEERDVWAWQWCHGLACTSETA